MICLERLIKIEQIITKGCIFANQEIKDLIEIKQEIVLGRLKRNENKHK